MSDPDSARPECQPLPFPGFTWPFRAPRQEVQVPYPRSTEARTPPWSGPAPQFSEISHTRAQCFPQTSWDRCRLAATGPYKPRPLPTRSPEGPALFTSSPAPTARRPRPLVYTRALPSPFGLKTQLLRTVSVLSPASSLASGPAEGAGSWPALG